MNDKQVLTQVEHHYLVPLASLIQYPIILKAKKKKKYLSAYYLTALKGISTKAYYKNADLCILQSSEEYKSI